MGSDGLRWVQMGSDGFRWVRMGSDGFRWVCSGGGDQNSMQATEAGARTEILSSVAHAHTRQIGDGGLVAHTLTRQIGDGGFIFPPIDMPCVLGEMRLGFRCLGSGRCAWGFDVCSRWWR